MALTDDEWFEKLKSWVPCWFFEEEENQVAHFKGLAKLLEEFQIQLDNHIKETFILQATGTFLDQHGDERTIPRLPGEPDSIYRLRIQSFLNKSNCPDLKDLIDAILIVPESIIIENYDMQLHYNRETFYNRNAIFIPTDYNWFTVIIPNQVHDPHSFYDREFFMDREDAYGIDRSLDSVFELIFQTINENKALGTLFTLIEKAE